MKDREKKQIKFGHENSESPTAQQHPGDLLHIGIQTNTRQTTLEEFFCRAREGVKGPNVN